ncbi:MAG: hypothetical protein L0G99_02035 [Propionibacteriales bacterium]|nr:hypothetical protein [Propionibacteriales bacterium]
MSPVSPTGPPAPQPASARPLGHEAFDRWYGEWDPLTPQTIGEFMDGFERPWWIVGGWSLEAYTRIARPHEDMDISILSTDAEAFRLFLGDRWTPWNVDDGWFRPFDDRFTDVRPDSQVWIRRDARSRWVLDVPFTPSTQGRWTNKRHLAHTEDLADVTWVAADGLRYAKPEVTLMFKAAQAREKDRIDAQVTLPLLEAPARAWLRDTIARFSPDHEWARTL